MGCCRHRKKQTGNYADQKWDHIQLQDFKAKGCGKPFAYGYLWFLLIVSVLVYAVDSFVAVNLLAFDRWSSQIEPDVPFKVSKWIFSICIILSFVNLGYEAIVATRVIKRGNVAESYLDPLAVRWQSIRVFGGQGFRRFMVFAELTKSKKGGEYIAMFTYFALHSWNRVLVCSGPRQVINALTLMSVYEAKLSVSSPSVEGSLTGFWDKFQAFVKEDYRQAIIVGSMAFTFVVWVFSVLFLIAGILFYVFFLFHWIPRADGGLAGYCERKVNKALLEIVTKKVNKALAKEEQNRWKADAKEAKKNGGPLPMSRMATLPDVGPIEKDKLPEMPMMSRAETMTTLPVYESRPGTPGGLEMGPMGAPRPAPSRSATGASYASNAPLVGGAAPFGRSNSPAPTIPDIDLHAIRAAPIMRPGTSNSNRSFSQPVRQQTRHSGSSVASQGYQQSLPAGREGGMGYANARSQPYQAFRPEGRPSPAPSGPPAYRDGTPQTRPGPGQMPPRSATAGPGPQRGPPQRNVTMPMPTSQSGPAQRPTPPQDYMMRQGTAPPPNRPMPPRDLMARPGTSQSHLPNHGRGYGYDEEAQRQRW